MPRKPKLPPGLQKRGRVYYAKFRTAGRVFHKRLSTSLDDALRMLTDLRARAYRNDYGFTDNNLSIAELRTQYERKIEQVLRPGTVTRYKLGLRNVLERISAIKVSHVSTDAIITYRRDRLAAGDSPRTINHDVGNVSTMFNWAVGQRLIGSNPLDKIDPLPTDGEKRKDRRSLSAEEVEAIFEASPDWLRPVLRMFAVTGMRRNEVTNLKFTDVDFERGVVIIRAKTAKTKREREIPLDDEMLATIIRLRDEAPFRRPGKGNTAKDTATIEKRFSKAHVFVTTAGTPWGHNLLKRFYAVCKRAGIRGAEQGGSVDLHAMRVTFTTLSIQNGGNPTDVQATLGHASLKMTMDIYSKTTDRGKRAAVSALPFAKVSNPGHVLPMTPVAKIGAVAKESSEVVAG